MGTLVGTRPVESVLDLEPMPCIEKLLLSGNEAVASAALDAGITLGTGYPGTPSTEILEHFDRLGGHAQWAPNEKVALEVAIGVAIAGGRALATMKHVGLNVAADPFFTVAYMDVKGALVVVSADDPGMASSQNEQDNRHYARAAAVAMFEPSDSQEAYDFTLQAIAASERWHAPVLLRLTTRVCHSKTLVQRAAKNSVPSARTPHFVPDLKTQVMIPAYARPAHHRLRAKLAQMTEWNEQHGPNQIIDGPAEVGIITSGISYQHVREAAPEARVLKLGMTHPLPLEMMRKFSQGVKRCLVIEEGDSFLVENARMAGISVEDKPAMYRFGELNVPRVRRILSNDTTPEPAPVPGKPPELCPGCPHRNAFSALKDLNTIASGDIGCYTLGVLPPFEALHTCVCMGASIGVGLGLRHALPPEEAKRVISVIGDSTFVHTGIPGIVEMVYNPPPTGHVVMILDNGITAMTGLQENPSTGRALNHSHTGKIVLEELVRSLGVSNVHVIDGVTDPKGLERLLAEAIEKPELSVIINRRTCLLATKLIKEYERCYEEQPSH